MRWKCRVACLRTEESQHPTLPHVRHSRRCTHLVPSRRQSTQPSGLFGVTSAAACVQVVAGAGRLGRGDQGLAVLGFGPCRPAVDHRFLDVQGVHQLGQHVAVGGARGPGSGAPRRVRRRASPSAAGGTARSASRRRRRRCGPTVPRPRSAGSRRGRAAVAAFPRRPPGVLIRSSSARPASTADISTVASASASSRSSGPSIRSRRASQGSDNPCSSSVPAVTTKAPSTRTRRCGTASAAARTPRPG